MAGMIERLLVTVRTYPTPSRSYTETVCTGGITDRHEWRRLFPVQFRSLDSQQQFRTYDLIDVEVSEGKDGRPETRRPNLVKLKVISYLKSWSDRCEWVEPTVLPSMQAMLDEGRTIAPVAVAAVQDLTVKAVDRDWSPEQKDKLRQEQLFDENRPLEKIPFEFRFIWKDGDGQEHKNLFLAWEIGQTWRTYRERYPDPIEKMRQKWLNDLCGANRRVSFFMGNLAKRRNVFAVCGIFNPPKKETASETLWSTTS